MTVTQNAGRREGPTAQISGAELSANSDLSAARGSRWPATVEEEAEACDRRRLAQGYGKKKITIITTIKKIAFLCICNGDLALTQAFSTKQKWKTTMTAAAAAAAEATLATHHLPRLVEKFAVNNGLLNRREGRRERNQLG